MAIIVLLSYNFLIFISIIFNQPIEILSFFLVLYFLEIFTLVLVFSPDSSLWRWLGCKSIFFIIELTNLEFLFLIITSLFYMIYYVCFFIRWTIHLIGLIQSLKQHLSFQIFKCGIILSMKYSIFS